MTLYLMNDAAFALPAATGVVDRTVTVVDTTTDGVLHTILVHRLAMPAGKTLAALAAENLRDAALRLPEHRTLFARESEVAGAPAIQQGARWRGRHGIVYTRVAHLAVRGTWLVLTATSALDDRAGCDAVMDHLLATFHVQAGAVARAREPRSDPGTVAAYHTNEASFELPGAEIVDRTTHVVETKHPDHDDVTLVVCRAVFPADKTIRLLARGRVTDEMTRLAGYAVLEERDAIWGELPVVELTSRWRYQGRTIYQQQAHLGFADTWIFFAMSAPIESRAPCDAWFEQLRSSLRMRSDI